MSTSRKAVGAAVAIALVAGCAQIKTTSRVEILPKKGGSVRLGTSTGQITARGATATWEQHASTLEVVLSETRRCNEVVHTPVVRVEHVTRKAGGALAWEYGLGAATLALGLTALIRPELFSADAINSQGDPVKDLRTGYRIGGIFTGISAALIGVGIYDTIRARDTTYYADAYQVDLGGAVDCAAPTVAMKEQTVELIVGDWSTSEETDKTGKVQFALPRQLDMPISPGAKPEPEPEPEPEPDAKAPPPDKPAAAPKTEPPTETRAAEPVEVPQPETEIRRGVIRIGPKRAFAVDFVVPYASEAAGAHTGQAELEPIGLGRLPPLKAGPDPKRKPAPKPKP